MDLHSSFLLFLLDTKLVPPHCYTLLAGGSFYSSIKSSISDIRLLLNRTPFMVLSS